MPICILSFFTSLFPVSIYLVCRYVIGDIASCENIYRGFLYVIQHPVRYVIYNPIKFIILFIFILEIILCIILKKYISKRFTENTMCDDIIISTAKKDGTLTTQYLLSNVLPIISLEFDVWYNIVFTIFLLMGLLVLYIKNNLFYLNPIFDFFNICVYNANISKIDTYSGIQGMSADITVITDGKLTDIPCRVKAQYYNGIYIIRKRE